jgi:rhodanese-related sulfurtransferase
MRTVLLAAILACAVVVPGCKASHDATTAAAVPTVSVDELDAALANKACQPVDANGDATRKKLGVIPGAILLSSEDSLAELPADKSKPLVFYCANTHCGASHHAAESAIAAGYTDVKVLPEGISGWVKANKKTQPL